MTKRNLQSKADSRNLNHTDFNAWAPHHGASGSRSYPAGWMWLLVALALLLFASASQAYVLAEAPGIRIIPSQEVLAAHTISLPSGDLLFEDAAGARIRLITDIEDPQIVNPGSGSFFPADEQVVLDALRQLPDRFLSELRVQVFILPYPRSGMLSSSADARAIYLSPGVRPYEPWQVHFLIAHEIGHCVHRRYLPDTDEAGWQEWAALRGVNDPSIFFASAPHADRPHEIFAEDFRVFFGGELARRDGSIENTRVAHPSQVPDLLDYYNALIETAPAAALAWQAGPNPIRSGQRMVLRAPDGWAGSSSDLTAALFDVNGRQVGRYDLRNEGSGQWSVSLDSDGNGERTPAGAYWLRLLDSPGAAGTTVSLRILR